MTVFDQKTVDAAEKMNKAKVKAAEFDGTGLTLQIISTERIKSQYGAEADASIVEKGILEEGEQFLFTFKDESGDERKLYSTSVPFFIGMQQAEINLEDWLHIRREGVKDKTRYFVNMVEAPVSQEKTGEEEIDPKSIPF